MDRRSGACRYSSGSRSHPRANPIALLSRQPRADAVRSIATRWSWRVELLLARLRANVKCRAFFFFFFFRKVCKRRYTLRRSRVQPRVGSESALSTSQFDPLILPENIAVPDCAEGTSDSVFFFALSAVVKPRDLNVLSASFIVSSKRPLDASRGNYEEEFIGKGSIARLPALLLANGRGCWCRGAWGDRGQMRVSPPPALHHAAGGLDRRLTDRGPCPLSLVPCAADERHSLETS